MTNNAEETLLKDWVNAVRIGEVLADQRDRARGIAVHLEQQLAEVAALHVRDEAPTAPVPFCVCCSEDWPCRTAQALGVEP